MEGEDFNFGLNNYDTNFDFLMPDADYQPDIFLENYCYGDSNYVVPHVAAFEVVERPLEEYKYEVQELDEYSDYSIVSESVTSSTFTTRLQDLAVDSKPVPGPLKLPPIVFPTAPQILPATPIEPPHVETTSKRSRKSRSISIPNNKRGRPDDKLISYLKNFVGTKVKNGVYPPKKKENLMTTVCRSIKSDTAKYRTLQISSTQRARYEKFSLETRRKASENGQKHMKVSDCQQLFAQYPELITEYLDDLKSKDLLIIESKLFTKTKHCLEHTSICCCRDMYTRLIDILKGNLLGTDDDEAFMEPWPFKRARLNSTQI